MRSTFIIAISALLLAACRTTESAMRHKLTGTWYMGLLLSVAALSGSDLVSFTYTFSPDPGISVAGRWRYKR